jgi:drug/metabolite transporter (DMT)-like permease
VFYGLLAALGWGTADLAAALSGRRIGSTRTAAIAQVTSFVVLVGAGVALGEAFAPGRTGTLILVANGVLAAAAYVSLYRSLELGPVALVSPIVAAYVAISILLAVVVRGETLGPLLIFGTLLTLGGAMLASTDIRRLRGGDRLFQAGIPWAFASMALFGVATFILGYWSQRIGWFAASTLSRVGNVAGVLLFAFLVRRRTPSAVMDLRNVSLAAVVGLADIGGVVAYAYGAQLGLISVVTAASAAFILIPVVGGLVLFGERPVPNQFVGIAGVFVGLVLLGLGS